MTLFCPFCPSNALFVLCCGLFVLCYVLFCPSHKLLKFPGTVYDMKFIVNLIRNESQKRQKRHKRHILALCPWNVFQTYLVCYSIGVYFFVTGFQSYCSLDPIFLIYFVLNT